VGSTIALLEQSCVVDRREMLPPDSLRIPSRSTRPRGVYGRSRARRGDHCRYVDKALQMSHNRQGSRGRGSVLGGVIRSANVERFCCPQATGLR